MESFCFLTFSTKTNNVHTFQCFRSNSTLLKLIRVNYAEKWFYMIGALSKMIFQPQHYITLFLESPVYHGFPAAFRMIVGNLYQDKKSKTVG